MKVKCDTCGKEFDRRPSTVKAVNYCSPACYHAAKQTTVKCEKCGKMFIRLKSDIKGHIFCSSECAKDYTREIGRLTMQTINAAPNHKERLRLSHLGKGHKDTYEKTFGRHTHRIVAEQILSRPLKPGEVVHHIDGNKRNNNPENLMVFASQALHAQWHRKHDKL